MTNFCAWSHSRLFTPGALSVPLQYVYSLVMGRLAIGTFSDGTFSDGKFSDGKLSDGMFSDLMFGDLMFSVGTFCMSINARFLFLNGRRLYGRVGHHGMLGGGPLLAGVLHLLLHHLILLLAAVLLHVLHLHTHTRERSDRQLRRTMAGRNTIQRNKVTTIKSCVISFNLFLMN